MRLSKALKDAHSKGPSNPHVRAARFWNSCSSKKSIILTPCTSTQRKLENEQRKSYRILTSSCWNTDIRLFDFYRKRGLGPDESHYNQSRRRSRLQTTLAQITRINPKWIYNEYCIENFFHRSIFLSNFLFPWNISLHWIYFLHWFFNMRWPWKQSLSWKYSQYWIYFVLFKIFEQLALKFFTVLNILFTFRIF